MTPGEGRAPLAAPGVTSCQRHETECQIILINAIPKIRAAAAQIITPNITLVDIICPILNAARDYNQPPVKPSNAGSGRQTHGISQD